jgi:hypothetical protein
MWMPSKPTGNYTPPTRPYTQKHVGNNYSNSIDASRDRDDDWEPTLTDDFHPTDAPSGSSEKVEVLRRRVQLGQPLWHAQDRVDYSGLRAATMPFVDDQHRHGQDED